MISKRRLLILFSLILLLEKWAEVFSPPPTHEVGVVEEISNNRYKDLPLEEVPEHAFPDRSDTVLVFDAKPLEDKGETPAVESGIGKEEPVTEKGGSSFSVKSYVRDLTPKFDREAKNYSDITPEYNYEDDLEGELTPVAVNLTANSKVSHDFFPAHTLNRDIYLDPEDLIEFIAAKDLEYNNGVIEGSYNFRNYKADMRSLDHITTPEGRLLVKGESLSKLRSVKISTSNYDDLEVKLELGFELVQLSEAKELKRRESIGEWEEEETYIKEDWKIFTPGVVDLNYNKDFDNHTQSLGMRYTNHILYGNLNLNYQVRDDGDNVDTDLTRWTWERDLYDDRKIVLGDVYQTSNSSTVGGGSMSGVTISRRGGWDYSTRVTKNSITGNVAPGTIVELYRNNVLVDYLTTTNGEYEFEVEMRGSDRYAMRMYYPDGRREIVDVNRINRHDLVSQGEFDYELQVGDAENEDGTLYNVGMFYGLSDTLTLGSNFLNSGDSEGNFSDFANLSLLKVGKGSNPYQAKLDYTFNEEGYDFEINLDSKFNKWSYTLLYSKLSGFEDYGYYGEEELDASLSYYLGPTILTYSYNEITANEEKRKNNTLEISYSYRNSYSSLYARYYEDYEVYSMSNTVFVDRRFSSVLESISTSIEKDTRRDEVKRSLRFSKNSNNGGGMTYSLQYDKFTEDKLSFEVGYYFNGFGELLYRSDNRNSTSGSMAVRTSVNLASEDKVSYRKHGGTSTIRGRVFVDSNADGVYNEGEVVLSNREFDTPRSDIKVKTNENGEYFVTNLSSLVEREIHIGGEDLGLYLAPPIGYKYKALPGGLLTIDIPILEMQSLTGEIFFSEDFMYHEVMEVLGSSSIVAVNKATKEKYEVDLEDEYYILEVPAGDYQIGMDYKGDQSIMIHDHGVYYIDLKGIALDYNAFKLYVSKGDIDGEEVYIVKLEGSDPYHDSRISWKGRESEIISFSKEN
ncbi:hypothetical protein PM10SUCC1_09070 [Propionigenium maris DSM 9537]|uniref:SD-repeat containing protein B domain-containing protein n=1 Tax=Propionigenium maris DSM 9537 TaxID=1123000 RepID=A0A9W6GJJ2_9FUSO|nr:hypothetical protein [Propionigenium maris]GLI55393.1 hypothetical protein PM10SUCC1_09070 [Propionigenium maris DSM 9537]